MVQGAKNNQTITQAMDQYFVSSLTLICPYSVPPKYPATWDTNLEKSCHLAHIRIITLGSWICGLDMCAWNNFYSPAPRYKFVSGGLYRNDYIHSFPSFF